MLKKDLENYVDKLYEEGTKGDDLVEEIYDFEVIYYGEAMELLNDIDNSLTEPCKLASDFGYELEDINSELLATLSAQEYMLNYASEQGYI